VRRIIFRAALIALAALALAGCIDSSGPILPDSQPVLGQRLRLQFYSLRKGFGYEPAQATFTWNGALYTHAGGGMGDVSAFSIHPFEAGDFIIQSVPAKRVRVTEYALMRKLAEGVYLVSALDENDADEATRTAYCSKADKTACRIETRAQLLAFARATAARQKDDGGLVIRLPDGSQREPSPRRTPPPR
jgi:hypothetical protein